WNGIILLNNPSQNRYTVRGGDVSRYQGQIDWELLASNDISFAFIKATEGSSHVDSCFTYNYEEACKTSLRIGAYHFFSYDSEGQTQADHYISIVEKTDDMLPPVIDLEFYGDKEQNPPAQDQVRQELTVMLDRLEEYYGMKPIIYATEKSYKLYLADAFQEYDIWIRNIFTSPRLSDHREWTFWQYTDRGKLEGYKGDEKCIDMNVFNGSSEDFLNYP
ncbi:MAG: glycoside hydrolase family 25 protein, partial [Acetatifactor sp.]|nr:glycoside hydrolase family 25 protein [Acetatifactor sp.]